LSTLTPLIRSAILRRSLPVAISAILIFICIREMLTLFFSPPLALVITFVTSSVIVTYLVFRSSAILGVQLEQALQAGIDERKRSEESVKSSLLEKEVLLKEIHHRVKNNLQVISSLLRLQAETARDKETAAFFLDSQERVRAMATVHEHLYGSSDLARINFPAYVAALTRNLYRTFGSASDQPPTIRVDNVQLSLDMAVPCGLLLTELISNAIKYAYPNRPRRIIQISFISLRNGMFELSVADNGVGFPDGFDWMKSDSLGLRLIRLLTEQLRGEVALVQNNGLRFVITFPGGE
jgi:two-component sensor histidine kinase